MYTCGRDGGKEGRRGATPPASLPTNPLLHLTFSLPLSHPPSDPPYSHTPTLTAIHTCSNLKCLSLAGNKLGASSAPALSQEAQELDDAELASMFRGLSSLTTLNLAGLPPPLTNTLAPVSDVGFRVQGSGPRVQGLGFRVLNLTDCPSSGAID